MEDVIRYLRGMQLRQQPVLAGIVENVVDVRKWEHWDQWLAEIRVSGYNTRLIALNSAHAQSRTTPRAPQSRDRLYVAYWHRSLGRDPDWDRYLRPDAWCPRCDQTVAGIQTWKRPGQDMGRYNTQYCPPAQPSTGPSVANASATAAGPSAPAPWHASTPHSTSGGPKPWH